MVVCHDISGIKIEEGAFSFCVVTTKRNILFFDILVTLILGADKHSSNSKPDRENYLWNGISEANVTFRPASTGLDHALVASGLTQILVETSRCRWGQLVTIHGGALLFDINFMILPPLSGSSHRPPI